MHSSVMAGNEKPPRNDAIIPLCLAHTPCYLESFQEDLVVFSDFGGAVDGEALIEWIGLVSTFSEQFPRR